MKLVFLWGFYYPIIIFLWLTGPVTAFLHAVECFRNET
jgi:hypothetical protein